MTTLTYRANLTAAEFPLLSEQQGRTVIVMGNDQNFSRQANSTRNKDRDIGIPQVYYCHNVIPTEGGMSSVGYQDIATAPLDTDNTFHEVFLVRDSNNNVAYFANTLSGRCYVLPSLGTGWLRTTDMAPAVGQTVTSAFINGETYIYFGKVGCYRYDFATNTLISVPLLGISYSTVIGITSANGYMIVWTENSVLWSSTISPTDFLPSLVTGAGSSSVQEVKGAIVACFAQNGGFLVYTRTNAVAAIFTGNVQNPFTFRENIAAGGISTGTLVAHDGNSSSHYAYTTSGLQEIALSQSNVIFPQVTDFIAGSQFEDYDDATGEMMNVLLSSPMQKKLTMISNRYLLISYGINALTHAILFDTALGRLGKLKTPHVDCFEYRYPSSDVVEAPRRSIGYLQTDGSIKVVVMSYDTTGAQGTLIMGKYQYERNTYTTMIEAHLESIRANSTLSVVWLTSIDGRNTTRVPTALAIDSGTYRRYNSRTTGLNHSLVVSGGFNLHSVEFRFTTAGDVR